MAWKDYWNREQVLSLKQHDNSRGSNMNTVNGLFIAVTGKKGDPKVAV